MLELSPQQIKEFQEKILSWYAKNKRSLPWRDMSNSIPLQERAYRILISEVMSQQTQISRVIPKYETWIAELPTVQDLAKAPTTEVLRLWSGLGYNRRALYLQRAAQEIVKGKVIWPETEKELTKLPGIGTYTARAIMCFAFSKQIAVVDTNVRRVILTQFPMSNFKYPISNRQLQQIADQLLPHGQANKRNQALMDYAAAILKKEKIPIPKQSAYRDSDRYYRGQIVKLLLQQKEMQNAQLHDYFNKEEKKITKERLEKVIAGLEKDKLIKKSKEKLLLP